MAVFLPKSLRNHGHAQHPVLHLLSQDPQIQGWEMRNQEVRGERVAAQRSNTGRRARQDRKDGDSEEGAGWGPGQRLGHD